MRRWIVFAFALLCLLAAGCTLSAVPSAAQTEGQLPSGLCFNYALFLNEADLQKPACIADGEGGNHLLEPPPYYYRLSSLPEGYTLSNITAWVDEITFSYERRDTMESVTLTWYRTPQASFKDEFEVAKVSDGYIAKWKQDGEPLMLRFSKEWDETAVLAACVAERVETK